MSWEHQPLRVQWVGNGLLFLYFNYEASNNTIPAPPVGVAQVTGLPLPAYAPSTFDAFVGSHDKFDVDKPVANHNEPITNAALTYFYMWTPHAPIDDLETIGGESVPYYYGTTFDWSQDDAFLDSGTVNLCGQPNNNLQSTGASYLPCNFDVLNWLSDHGYGDISPSDGAGPDLGKVNRYIEGVNAYGAAHPPGINLHLGTLSTTEPTSHTQKNHAVLIINLAKLRSQMPSDTSGKKADTFTFRVTPNTDGDDANDEFWEMYAGIEYPRPTKNATVRRSFPLDAELFPDWEPYPDHVTSGGNSFVAYANAESGAYVEVKITFTDKPPTVTLTKFGDEGGGGEG